MNMDMKIVITILIVALLAGCGSAKKDTTMVSDMKKIEVNSIKSVQIEAGGTPQSTSPAVYIYKTKADYSQLVPVLMNDDRTRILSYPAPSDLKQGDGLRLPTPLAQGYWLDNKGINRNVAFLTYTYEEYSKLPSAPTMEQLMASIAEKYPLVELRECGRRADYSNIVTQLNEIITQQMVITQE